MENRNLINSNNQTNYPSLVSLNLHLYSYVYSKKKKKERELTVLKDTVSLKQDAESPLNTNLPFVCENLYRWIFP